MRLSDGMCVPWASLVPSESEEGLRSLGTGIAGGYGPSCGRWQLKEFAARAAGALNHSAVT